jgi:hypothetical protein
MDLDIDTRTVWTPMPQVVPDLLAAMASFEQMTGTGVAQPVWAIALPTMAR